MEFADASAPGSADVSVRDLPPRRGNSSAGLLPPTVWLQAPSIMAKQCGAGTLERPSVGPAEVHVGPADQVEDELGVLGWAVALERAVLEATSMLHS